MSLASRSMFASLTIRTGQASATDRAVAIKAEKEHEAQNRTIKAVKSLVPSEYLIPIKRIATLGRDRHEYLTLPFARKGVQLLATRMFDEYAFEQAQIKESFFEEVKRFEDIYPGIVDKAPQRLGRAYRPEDFPAPEQIRNYFDYDVKFSPVPDTGNWLLDDVNTVEMEELRNQVENENNKMFREATQELFDRAKATLENLMTQALSYKEGQSNGALLRDPTLDAVKEMASLLSAMNITADPMLEVISKEMMDKLSDLDSQELRQSAERRTQVADITKGILQRMKGAA